MKYKVKLFDGENNTKTYTDKQAQMLAAAEQSQVINLNVNLTKTELTALKSFLMYRNEVSNEAILQGTINAIVKGKVIFI